MSSKHAIIFAFAVAGLSLVACSPSPALARPVIASAHSGSVYSQAVALLDSGRDYEAAAALLQTVIKSEPGNPAYHTALACAYADRAASLSYALGFRQLLAQLQAAYPKDIASWQADQADKTKFDYGSPRPAPPKNRVFPTKDDGKLLNLSDAQVIAQVTSLASQAQQEWQTGIRLSPPGSKRAAAEESFGWGLRLFERCQSNVSGTQTLQGLTFANDSRDRIVSVLSAAARYDPKDSAYWQNIGDELWGSNLDEYFGFPPSDKSYAMLRALPQAAHAAENAPDALNGADTMVAAYCRSLELQPDNADLWVRLFEFARESKPDIALTMLHSSIRYEPQDARLHYEEAELLFKQTPYGHIEDTPVDYDSEALIPQVVKEETSSDTHIGNLALQEIQRGNICKDYAAPAYRYSVPAVLHTGWEDRTPMDEQSDDLFEEHYERIRDLARQATGFAFVSAYEHHAERAVAAEKAIVGMGSKLAGDWPTRDSKGGGGEVLRTLVGIAVMDMGYACLLRVGDMTGDDAIIKRAKDRQADMEQRRKAYEKEAQANFSTEPVGYGSLLDRC